MFELFGDVKYVKQQMYARCTIFFFRNSSFFAFTYVHILDSFSHFALATYSQWCNECLQLFGNFFSSLFCVLFSYFKSNIEKKHNILTVHSHPRGIERINAIPITRKLKRLYILYMHMHSVHSTTYTSYNSLIHFFRNLCHFFLTCTFNLCIADCIPGNNVNLQMSIRVGCCRFIHSRSKICIELRLA